MVDASIVPAPKQSNTREENEAIQRGETPAEWDQKPTKKDNDARWAKKHGKNFFGYRVTDDAAPGDLNRLPASFFILCLPKIISARSSDAGLTKSAQ